MPDEHGRTNKLQRYISQGDYLIVLLITLTSVNGRSDITIRLPDDKKIKSLKWLAVWDLRDNRNFADIYIPDGFEPPSPQRVAELSRNGHGIRFVV